MDINAIRAQFPLLRKSVVRDGKKIPLVYLDSAATALKPQTVIDAITDYYTNYSVNIHRGSYEMSQHVTDLFERTRVDIAEYFNVGAEYAVLFTTGVTEAINLIAYSWARHTLNRADEILSTEIEHHANIVPWQQVCAATGCTLRHIPIEKPDFLPVVDPLDRWVADNTKVLAITGMSNVTGWRPPLPRILAAARERNIVTIVDGAQLAAHTRIDIALLGCDFFACSAHKMCGPTGIGILIAKKSLLAETPLFISGGNMIENVSLTHSTFKKVPEKFEAGTPHIAGVLGFRAAIQWLRTLDFAALRQHERALTEYACSELSRIPGVKIYGNPLREENGGIVAFNVRDVHAHDVGNIVDQEGVAVRAGHHCAQPYHRALAIDSTARASFHIYNQLSDIDQLAIGIRRAAKIFG